VQLEKTIIIYLPSGTTNLVIYFQPHWLTTNTSVLVAVRLQQKNS